MFHKHHERLHLFFELNPPFLFSRETQGASVGLFRLARAKYTPLVNSCQVFFFPRKLSFIYLFINFPLDFTPYFKLINTFPILI